MCPNAVSVTVTMVRLPSARSSNVVMAVSGPPYRGETWRLARLVEKPGAREEEEHDLRAPMPGVVARVLAGEGQEVAKGTPLLVLTAMKMEHEIRSPRAGRLVKLFRSAGERVDSGDPLAEIE